MKAIVLLKKMLLSGMFLLFFSLSAAHTQNNWDESYIMDILRERVEVHTTNLSIVVGLIDAEGSRVYNLGTRIRGGIGGDVDGNTIYEIGSITKTFTSLLLADMVEKGEVSFDDPVQKFLPDSVKIPTRNGKEITLQHLITHMSGLPRDPGNLNPGDFRHPYGKYTVKLLYDFLSNYTLTRDIGVEFEYSNLGVGLLGHALGLKAGKEYEELVIERICNSLSMNDTRITLAKEQIDRMALPHDKDGYVTLKSNFPTLKGCGALRSTAHDMLAYLAANMGFTETDLSSVIENTHQIREYLYEQVFGIGLAWYVQNYYGSDIVYHTGGTPGYISFAGFDKEKGIGVVVLTNSFNDISDIGMHLLDERYELVEHRTEITLDTETLELYTGMYETAPGIYATVTRSGNRIFVQFTYENMYEVFAEAENDFFYKVANAQISFVQNEEGVTSHFIFHQGGEDYEIKKLGLSNNIIVPGEILDTYTGEYEYEGSDDVFTVTRAGNILYCIPPDSEKAELHAESETDFFMSSENSVVVFNPGQAGSVQSITLYKGGSITNLMKSDAVTTVAHENIHEQPRQLLLLQNSPNPFNPVTAISYVIPEAGKVNLTVYNITGQMVAELVDSEQSAGMHTVSWNAAGMPSGLYFYRLQAEDFTGSKRMLLVK